MSTALPPRSPALAAAASDAVVAAARTTAIAFVLEREGGYVNNPADPGGATNLGVTIATLAAWRGVPQSALRPADVRALTREEAEAIYTRWYWGPSGCPWLAAAGAAGVALAQLDWAVNAGGARATRYLQAALNRATGAGLVIDGEHGPKTRAALASLVARPDPDAALAGLVRDHCELRAAHYRLRANVAQGPFDAAWARATLEAAGLARIAPRPDPDARQFLPGWLARLRHVARATGAPIAAPYAKPAPTTSR